MVSHPMEIKSYLMGNIYEHSVIVHFLVPLTYLLGISHLGKTEMKSHAARAVNVKAEIVSHNVREGWFGLYKKCKASPKVP